MQIAEMQNNNHHDNNNNNQKNVHTKNRRGTNQQISVVGFDKSC